MLFVSNPEKKAKEIYSLEILKIKKSLEEKDINDFESHVGFSEYDHRIEVSLPWKSKSINLHTNNGKSLRKLKEVFKKLILNSRFFYLYNNVITEQLSLGIIEEVKKKYTNNLIYYIPHQQVYREDKDKMRTVFDASANPSKDSSSLYKLLNPALILLENLVGILIQFRCFTITVSCDVEKAFLQLSVKKEDRYALRFL